MLLERLVLFALLQPVVELVVQTAKLPAQFNCLSFGDRRDHRFTSESQRPRASSGSNGLLEKSAVVAQPSASSNAIFDRRRALELARWSRWTSLRASPGLRPAPSPTMNFCATSRCISGLVKPPAIIPPVFSRWKSSVAKRLR